MVSETGTHFVRVLCVVPTPDNSTHPLLLAANDLDARVETAGDVYVALARLGSPGAPCFDAVLVDVTGVDAAEMEFFDLVSRCHQHVPALVFGDEGAQGKIDQALLRGARGTASPERLRELVLARSAVSAPPAVDAAGTPRTRRDDPWEDAVESPPPTRTGGAPGSVEAPVDEPLGEPSEPVVGDIDVDLERRLTSLLPPEPAESEAVVEPPNEPTEERTAPTAKPGQTVTPPAGAVAGNGAAAPVTADRESQTASPSPARPGAKKEDKGRSGSSARVPWQHYEKRPHRMPPRSGADMSTGLPTIKPVEPKSAAEDDPPLLTPEELDALVGGPPTTSSEPADPDAMT